MEVGFYCEDAGDLFLKEKSVDLFFSQPPYFHCDNSRYGGDISRQMHNKSHDEYLNFFVRLMNHMTYALKDTGSIVLILKNITTSFDIISEIRKNVNIHIDRAFIWNYVDSHFVKNINGDEFAIILHMHKGRPYIDFNKLPESFVIDLPWNLMPDLDKYQDISLVTDAFSDEIAEIFINLFSKPGDVVSDLCAGTGTTCIVADRLGRDYIYNDASSDQATIAKMRLHG